MVTVTTEPELLILGLACLRVGHPVATPYSHNIFIKAATFHMHYSCEVHVSA